MPKSWDDLKKVEDDKKHRKRLGRTDQETEEAAQERTRHGEMRHALHESHTTHRPLSKNYDAVGIAGEQSFAKFMDVAWDKELKPGGTNNINFTIGGKTVNVATARFPKYLLVEVGKAKADYYVLAMYREGLDAKLMGWATQKQVLEAPTEDKGHFGIVSHFIAWEKLAKMDELRDILKPPPKQESLI